MQYINGFEKEMTLTRRLKTWKYKLNINLTTLMGIF